MQEQIDQFLRALQDEKGYSPNTIAAYRNDLYQFAAFLKRTADDPVSSWPDVDSQLVHKYSDFVRQQGYASSTIARKVASVKSFFSYMQDTGQLSNDPTVELRAPKVTKPIPRILSTKEVETLLAEPARTATPKAQRDRALLELLYATGMRVSEVVTLQLDDLDMTESHMVCTGPGGKEREAPLTPRAFDALSVYLEKGRSALVRNPEEMALFVNQRGSALTRQGLWLIIKSYAKASDMGADVTPHTLRHSCAVHRLASGSEPQEVRELLGLANMPTPLVYMDKSSPFVDKSSPFVDKSSPLER